MTFRKDAKSMYIIKNMYLCKWDFEKKVWKSKQTSWYGEFSEFGIEIGLLFALNKLYLCDRKLPNCCEIVAKYVNVKNRGKL